MKSVRKNTSKVLACELLGGGFSQSPKVKQKYKIMSMNQLEYNY